MYHENISNPGEQTIEQAKANAFKRVRRQARGFGRPENANGAHGPKTLHSDAVPVFRTVRSLQLAPGLGKSDESGSVQVNDVPAASEKPASCGPKSVDGGRDSSYSSKMNSALGIYTSHFNLHTRPFTLVPDPDFLFWSSVHRRAYTMLEYGILTGSPITLITGDVGAGKTTLLHRFLNGIGDDLKIGLVSNAHGSRGELLRWVLMSLDQPADRDATYVDLFDSFQKYLIEQYAAGKRVLLVFDEAQNLSIESLEELRMFTNINSNKDELLQLVLVGQPELRDTIHRPDLRQFAQRIAASFHLTAMDEKTVSSYIGHRLRVAGAQKNLFADAACKIIHEQTGGIPRLVNQLCDLAMVYAFTKDQKTVTSATVQEVLNDGTFFAAGAFSKDQFG